MVILRSQKKNHRCFDDFRPEHVPLLFVQTHYPKEHLTQKLHRYDTTSLAFLPNVLVLTHGCEIVTKFIVRCLYYVCKGYRLLFVITTTITMAQ